MPPPHSESHSPANPCHPGCTGWVPKHKPRYRVPKLSYGTLALRIGGEAAALVAEQARLNKLPPRTVAERLICLNLVLLLPPKKRHCPACFGEGGHAKDCPLRKKGAAK